VAEKMVNAASLNAAYEECDKTAFDNNSTEYFKVTEMSEDKRLTS
jgi:hypothetical protein